MDRNKIITGIILFFFAGLELSCNQPAPKPPVDSKPLSDLLKRNIPWMENKVYFQVDSVPGAEEKCKLEMRDGQLLITANSKVAAATGLNWYLKYYYHKSISHTGDNMDAPEKVILPPLNDTVSITSNYQYRYALNYCTINYTMSFWDWPRWEKELDWMAMNGINLILAPLGNELVWYNVLQKMGIDDSTALTYSPGPAFTAWWLMGNLQGWQGPLSKDFIQKQAALQQKILSRCRELGITPVLQGFYGIVPEFLQQHFPNAKIVDQGKWEGGFARSSFLDPSDSLFTRIADLYYQELQRLYGTDARYFGGDPFHEGGKTGGLDLTHSGQLIYQAAAKHYPGATWVLQAWQGNPQPALLNGFGGHALILDLFGESDNYWEQRKGYEGYPWLWCMINNFGEKTGMIGKLQRASQEPARAHRSKYGNTMKGIGIIPEGINNNAVLYDLLLESAWRDQPVDLSSWVKEYSYYRYGVKDEHLENAWELLLKSVYSTPADYNILGPTESVMLAKPSFNDTSVSTWGTTRLFYDTAVLKNAAVIFMNLAPAYWNMPTFRYDCIDVCRQLLSDRSLGMYTKLKEDYAAKKTDEFKKDKTAFLQLILQQDSLCSLDTMFTLEHWLKQAKALAGNDTERQQFVQNAKVQISYWGPDDPKSSLIDYANKQWSGMLRTYYYDRWKAFLDELEKRAVKGNFSTREPVIDYFKMQKAWAMDSTQYSEGSLISDRDVFLGKIIADNK